MWHGSPFTITALLYSTLSLSSALDGGGWSMPWPNCFTPGEDIWYPLYRRLAGN